MDIKIQDSMYEGPDNEQAFIPYEVFNELTNAKDPQMIVFQPISADLHSEALMAARNVIGRRHHFEPSDTKATPEWDTVESGQMLRPSPSASTPCSASSARSPSASAESA